MFAYLDDVCRIRLIGHNRARPWWDIQEKTLSCGPTSASAPAAGGVTKDIGHISYGYGLFTGGLAPTAAASARRHCSVSVGNTAPDSDSARLCQHLHLLHSLHALYIAKPSRTRESTQHAAAKGFFLRRAVTKYAPRNRAPPQSRHPRHHTSEIIGPGVAFECSEKNGLHINEDHFYPEIVDPDNGEPLPDGVAGELVFTCLTKEALPLIRYRTHDVAKILREPCSCGRTLIKMSKPAGRTDDMLIIRGVNVFPSQIESVLLEFSAAAPFFQIVVDRVGALDTLEINVELTTEAFSDEVRHLEDLGRR